MKLSRSGKTFFFSLFVLLTLCSFVSADQAANLFADHGPDQRKSWKSHGSVDVEETAAGPVFRIETSKDNDISLIRRIPVQKGHYYRFSASIRTSDVRGPLGANLGIYGTYNHSPGLRGAHEWTEIEEVFRAVEDGRIPFALRLGYWDAPAGGTAWFRDVRVEELNNWRGHYQPIEKTAPKEAPSTLPLRALIFFFLAPYFLFCLAWVRNGWFAEDRSQDAAPSPLYRHRGFWGLFASAFIVRLLMAPYAGMSADLAYLKSIALQLGTSLDLFLAFFQGEYPNGLPLVCTYLLAAIGALVRLLNAEAGQAFVVLVKSPAIVCELVLVGLVLHGLRRWGAGKKAWLCAALIAFHPGLLLLTPFWGQLEIVQVTFLLAGVLALLDRRSLLAGVLFGLGISADIRFFFLALLLVAAAWRQAGRPGAFRAALGCCAAGVLLWLPGLAGGMSGLRHLAPIEAGALGAFNFWTVLGLNWQSITPFAWSAAIAFCLFILAMAAWQIPGRRSTLPEQEIRRRTLIVFFLFAEALFLFLPGAQARFLLPALIFLVPAMGLGRRHRWTFVFLSLFLFFNLVHVFWNAAYLGKPTSADSAAIRAAAGLLTLQWALAFILEGWQRRGGRFHRSADLYRRFCGRFALPAKLEPAGPIAFKMRAGDWCALLLITALGVGLIFFRLGERDFPTRGLMLQGESATFELDLGSPHEIARAGFFGGEIAPEIRFLKSEDGRWRPLWDRRDGLLYYYTRQDYRKTFKNAERSFPPATADKLRLIVYGEQATVNEIVLFDAQNRKIVPKTVRSLPIGEEAAAASHPFFDEPQKANLIGSYRSKTYWDEVFYARSAYDLVRNEEPYERTHPPLGKSLIALGVKGFEMTPFGWRFTCAVAIALMPALMFFGGRWLTGERSGAYLAALLMVFEGMTLTVGRMANIDGFLILFETAMLLCLLKWYLSGRGVHSRRTSVWLVSAGLFFGLAFSIKWSALFLGFAVFLLVVGWKTRGLWHAWRSGSTLWLTQPLKRGIASDLGIWLGCFVALPLLIYYLSHFDYLASLSHAPSLFSREGVIAFWHQQEYILGFHGGSKVGDSHSLASPFYAWPLMLKPVTNIFQNGGTQGELRSAISMFGNPVVWWTGLAAIILVGWSALRAKRPVFVMVAAVYFLPFMPWILVQRPTFLYAYLPFLPPLVWGTALVFSSLGTGKIRFRSILVFSALAVATFAFYYPSLTGLG